MATPTQIPASKTPLTPAQRAARLAELFLASDPANIADEDTPQPDSEPQQDPDTAPQDDAEPVAEPDTGSEPVPPEADEGDVEPTPDATPAPELFPVKIDGKEQKVTREELLAGYSRTSDYTKKTQALAEQRRALEAKSAEVTDTHAKYIENLRKAEEAVGALTGEPDWKQLKAELPGDEFAEVWEQHQQYKARLKSIADTRQAEQKKLADAATKVAQDEADAEYEHLLNAFPTWRDDESKRVAGLTDIVKYAESIGYPAEVIHRLVDHKAFIILDKARRYDELVAKKGGKPASSDAPAPRASRTVPPGSPIARPTANQTKAKEYQAARAKARKSGKPQDFAKVFEMLEG